VSDWNIGGVGLPYNPYTVQVKDAADLKAYRYPSQLALLISFGKKARILTLEGYIAQSGKDKSFLETEYIIPLRNKVGTQVTVQGPDTRYDETWIMNSFTVTENRGEVVSFTYRMELWLGHQHEVV